MVEGTYQLRAACFGQPVFQEVVAEVVLLVAVVGGAVSRASFLPPGIIFIPLTSKYIFVHLISTYAIHNFQLCSGIIHADGSTKQSYCIFAYLHFEYTYC